MATPLEIALRPVAHQVSSYRANREHPRAPFPVEIWQNLSKLAQVYGTAAVAKQARVDATTLASHVRKLQTAEPDFIECMVGSGPVGFAAKVEVETRGGDVMRIESSSFTVSDLSHLLKEFLVR